mmetsp:Transcript_12831/g.36896  ORF Transcript_12831/g.36896 Transcript_12831/m.36896 type:complete len:319 (-) Transcript_12831:51-1007(-)
MEPLPPLAEIPDGWRDELRVGSRVWVLKASINLWYEGVVVKAGPAEELKVQFMDGGVPCCKMVKLSSEEIQKFDGVRPAIPRRRFSSEPTTMPPPDVEVPPPSAAEDVEEALPADQAGQHVEVGAASSSSCWVGLPPSATRSYSELSSLTHTSMPELTPFVSDTRGSLPLVNEHREVNFGGEAPFHTFDALPAMRDAPRGRAVGARMKVRSASAGRAVDAVCIDCNDQNVKVFFSVGDRNFVKTLAAGDIGAEDNEQVIPGTHVRVRSASVGRPVEGVVTDATADRVRVQYFVDGRSYIKTVALADAELTGSICERPL